MKFNSFIIIASLFGIFTLSSCATKKTKPTTEAPEIIDSATVDNGKNNGMSLDANGDSDSNRAGGLKTVYFDYSSSSITTATKETLTQNAEFLKTNPNVKIQIEGHCDERGSVQYNLALGERRANSVRDFLLGLGVKAVRMTTISLGKEKPLAFGHDEESWSKNRRGNFVVTEK